MRNMKDQDATEDELEIQELKQKMQNQLKKQYKKGNKELCKKDK